jgi:hypothetical protein
MFDSVVHGLGMRLPDTYRQRGRVRIGGGHRHSDLAQHLPSEVVYDDQSSSIDVSIDTTLVINEGDAFVYHVGRASRRMDRGDATYIDLVRETPRCIILDVVVASTSPPRASSSYLPTVTSIVDAGQRPRRVRIHAHPIVIHPTPPFPRYRPRRSTSGIRDDDARGGIHRRSVDLVVVDDDIAIDVTAIAIAMVRVQLHDHRHPRTTIVGRRRVIEIAPPSRRTRQGRDTDGMKKNEVSPVPIAPIVNAVRGRRCAASVTRYDDRGRPSERPIIGRIIPLPHTTAPPSSPSSYYYSSYSAATTTNHCIVLLLPR